MLVVADKPRGLRSFEVVKILKNYLKEKVGHAGTLDPMATGLMILATGKDTKKLGYWQNQNKIYYATIDFSILTDTWDLDYWEKIERYEVKSLDEGKNKADNKVLLKDGKEIPAPSLEKIKDILESLKPIYTLPVPSFSAKRIKGKRMYELARSGQEVDNTKAMKILDFEILDYNFPELKVKFEVGSGTYIRSIAYWLGQKLGLGGILTQLHRESIGEISLENFSDFRILPVNVRGKEYELKFTFFEF